LTEVMLAVSLANPQAVTTQTTAEPAFTPVPTKDTSQVSVLLTQAQNQFSANDWEGLLTTVNKMRNIDPSYEPIKVDALYYYALRHNGISQIKLGHLEEGLYYFAMADQIAAVEQIASDSLDVESWRNWARLYQIAASWYGVNWYKSAEAFYTVYHEVPNLIGLTGMTSKQGYVDSLEGIGDILMSAYDYCNAVVQYQSAKDILVDDILLNKFQLAQTDCANPPSTPTPTIDPNAPPPTPTVDSYDPTH
jgi:hypothetical protein